MIPAMRLSITAVMRRMRQAAPYRSKRRADEYFYLPCDGDKDPALCLVSELGSSDLVDYAC